MHGCSGLFHPHLPQSVFPQQPEGIRLKPKSDHIPPLLNILPWLLPPSAGKLKSSLQPTQPSVVFLCDMYSVAHSALATLASLLILKHPRHSPALGPLHCLHALPGSEICMAKSPTSFICVKIDQRGPLPHTLDFPSMYFFRSILYCIFILFIVSFPY